MHVTTIAVSSNLVHGEVQHYVIKFVSDLFTPGTPVSSINKTDRRDITEILSKVTLNAITLTLQIAYNIYFH